MTNKFLPLVLVLTFLNGCALTNIDSESNQNTNDETAQKPEICDTLAEVEVSTILNSLYEATTVEFLSEGADGCKYIATEKKNDKTRTLNFIVRHTNAEQQSKDEFYRAVNVWQNSALENRTYDYIDNVGTEAFFTFNEKTPQLISYKNNTLVIVTFGNFAEDSDTILEKAKSVTIKLLDRL